MKLALGTVQFGLDYGITNQQGQVDLVEVKRILEYAQSIGIQTLDTATAYGTSEQALGQCQLNGFSLISKIGTLSSGLCPQQEVEQSLNRLGISQLYALLLHEQADTQHAHAAQFFKQLEQLKAQGLVKKIGVSFYSEDVAYHAINSYPLDIIQIPANHLHHGFSQQGVLALAQRKQIEVHARSLFLQGLLIAKTRPVFAQHADLMQFDKVAKQLKLTQLELALSYLFKQPAISKAVVGCVSLAQLQEIVQAYQKVQQIYPSLNIENLSSNDTQLINPTLW